MAPEANRRNARPQPCWFTDKPGACRTSREVAEVDARTKTIVWRGTATKDIDVNANPDKRDKNIAKTTEKLFKSYPPQAR